MAVVALKFEEDPVMDLGTSLQEAIDEIGIPSRPAVLLQIQEWKLVKRILSHVWTQTTVCESNV